MDSYEDSSILVTGGRGFIGRAAAKLLQYSGFRVVSLDRNGAEPVPGESCLQVQCDLADASQLKRVFEKERIGGIIHLAAILPTAAQRNPLLATQVNIEGSVHLLEMARDFGVQRLVFGGSLSIYGTYAADRTVSEFDRAAPEDLYGAAKLYVEQLGQAYRDCHGVDFVSLRIARVVGPGAQSVSSPWRSEIFELLKVSYPAEIRVPYGPSERILVLHVDDLAAMLVALLRAPCAKYSVYNAPCLSVAVGDLKRVVEDLNSNITVDAWGRAGSGKSSGTGLQPLSGGVQFRDGSYF